MKTTNKIKWFFQVIIDGFAKSLQNAMRKTQDPPVGAQRPALDFSAPSAPALLGLHAVHRKLFTVSDVILPVII